MQGYLVSHQKEKCFGCGACYQACPVQAINMEHDEEGFCYPVISEEKCIHCDKCINVCPVSDADEKLFDIRQAWGGYYEDLNVREASTSGGAFTAIAEEWLKDGGVLFGAELREPTKIVHSYVSDIADVDKFRKSKYLQSDTGMTFQEVKQFLKKGEKFYIQERRVRLRD